MRRGNVVDGGCPWWLGSNVVASPADKLEPGWHWAWLRPQSKKSCHGCCGRGSIDTIGVYVTAILRDRERCLAACRLTAKLFNASTVLFLKAYLLSYTQTEMHTASRRSSDTHTGHSGQDLYIIKYINKYIMVISITQWLSVRIPSCYRCYDTRVHDRSHTTCVAGLLEWFTYIK